MKLIEKQTINEEIEMILRPECYSQIKIFLNFYNAAVN